VSLLTGFASAAGTVAETDTILAAVGKLDGNIALRATTASLYPYIGGKLLTYLDEEAAIADPLISAGDIYRKTAGGVDYVNPDNVPSLDLRFATDKTLTARRGPTPTFSRASSGTFVNANGLIVGKTAGTTSSITPNTQAIGSQVTVTVASGSVVGWVVGQAISLIVDTDGQDDPDATELWLLGNIVSTTDTTLVFSVTSRTTQAGSATSWTLGYRGPRFDHDPVSRTNLLVRSNELNISPWGPATVTVEAVAGSGLDGGNAWRLTPTGSDSALGQARTIAASSPHTFSVWLKSDTGSNVSLSLSVWDNTASTNRGVKSITVTTQWQRFDITTSTVVAGNTTSFNIGAFGSWATGENILAWGAQLEAGSTATSYIPTTTASVTIHDCRGLLIEEGRTNFLLQSENFATASWGKSNSSISGTLHTAPTGALTANELVEDMLNATHQCFQNGPNATIGTTYTFSVFVKRKPSSNQFLLIGATGLVSASFLSVNLTNGAISTGIGSPAVPINVSSTAYPDGWYKVQFSVVATVATVSTLDIRLSRDGTWANRFYLGDGVQSSLIWGAQLEVGSFPTSYIPTTTGTLARGADVCNITGGNFNNFYNQSEGTFLSSTQLFSVGNDYNASYWNVFNTPNYMRVSVYSQTSTQESSYLQNNDGTLYSVVPSEQSRISRTAGAYQLNNARIVKNGTLGVLDTTFTPHSNLISLNIMSQASGTINSLRYYRKRLPDAKLQALTV
jgi:membrane protein YqaA with SNARE-associated domain